MKTRWIEPSREKATRFSKIIFKNRVNSAGVISPEAIAKSRRARLVT